MTRTIKASEFKATCLKLMDEVNETGEPITITKNGARVALLVPARAEDVASRTKRQAEDAMMRSYLPPAFPGSDEEAFPRTLWGSHAGLIRSHGDLDEPQGEPWEAES